MRCNCISSYLSWRGFHFAEGGRMASLIPDSSIQNSGNLQNIQLNCACKLIYVNLATGQQSTVFLFSIYVTDLNRSLIYSCSLINVQCSIAVELELEKRSGNIFFFISLPINNVSNAHGLIKNVISIGIYCKCILHSILITTATHFRQTSHFCFW